MGMKKHMNEMETVEMLINMMNEKIAADELATEISVPVMIRKRNVHHFSKADRSTMKKAARQRNMELAELRKSEKEKAWKDNELWYVYRLFEGTDRDYYIASEVDKKDMWHPFTKAERHKGIEKFYTDDSSNGNADNDPWAYEESGYWTEYLKAKEMAETIAATEIAEWKETAQFYATKANAFRMEVLKLRNLLKANGIDF